MFGRSLSEQTQLEGQDVPWVVRACVQFIEAEGLTLEGVYRKSGSSTDIRMIQIHISQVAASTNSKFFDTPIATPDTDVTSVTSVLKQYFRDLPNPLLTFETYHLWVQASNIASVDERIKVYRTISDSMPRAHSETLKFLMAHLKNISDSHQDNKMTTNNLSVVFAPNILHMPKSNVLEEMANMSGINQTVKFLIHSGGRNNASAANDNVSPTYSLQQQPTSSPTSPIQGSASIDSDGMPLANGINDAVGSLSSAMENASLSHSMPSPMGYMSQFMSKNSGPPGAQEKDPYRKQIARNSNLNGGRTQASFDFPRD
ncbi:Rho-type gtpase-activating protein [Dipsacomyces acuminosporus]|nr:Rho-type gtpase-activating protein [Dipsacomyces acuminosporus]